MSKTCPVVHFEMPYEDPERVANFYAAAFGWESRHLGPEMGDYVLAETGQSRDGRPQVAGQINGGFYPNKPDWPGQNPSVVIAVDDIAARIALVKAAGGEVLGEPMEIPGIGHYVAFRDSEGNRVTMLQPDCSGA